MKHPAGTNKPSFVVDCKSIDCQVDETRDTSCRKDIGEPAGKIRSYSRGHVFIVRSCGHVDWWDSIFKLVHDMLVYDYNTILIQSF